MAIEFQLNNVKEFMLNTMLLIIVYTGHLKLTRIGLNILLTFGENDDISSN